MTREKGERTVGERGRQVSRSCWTIGHSTLSAAALVDRLAAHRIECVADVRRYPASRRHPHFAREILSRTLAESGIEYEWHEALGGRRRALEDEQSPNRGIENPSFRAYADHMQTEEFERAFAALLASIGRARTALMCAEALWWRCHRRLLSDLLVARGIDVIHIRSDGKSEPHRMWELAIPAAGRLVYPPEQSDLDLGGG